MNWRRTAILGFILSWAPVIGMAQRSLTTTDSREHPLGLYEPLTSPESQKSLHDVLNSDNQLTQSAIVQQSAVVHQVGYASRETANAVTRLTPSSAVTLPSVPTPYTLQPSSVTGVDARDMTLFQARVQYQYIFTPMALRVGVTDYMVLSQIFEGMNSTNQVDPNDELMQLTMGVMDTMISKAGSFANPGGRRGRYLGWWATPDDPALGDYNNRTLFSVAAEMARTAALILTNERWRDVYRQKAFNYINFVVEAVMERFYVTEWNMTLPWLNESTWNPSAGYFGAMLAALYQATGDVLYANLARQLAENFKSRLREKNSGWIWDEGAIAVGSDKSPFALAGDVGNQAGVPDTVSAGASVKMMVYMYEAGLYFGYSDIARMTATLTDTLWDKFLREPSFSNYLDGSNKPYRNVSGYQNGIVGFGWSLLGRYSQLAQNVLTQYFYGVVTADSTPRAPSIDASKWWLGVWVALPGNLSRWMLSTPTGGKPVAPPAENLEFLSQTTGQSVAYLAPGMKIRVNVPGLSKRGGAVRVTMDGIGAQILRLDGDAVEFVIPSGTRYLLESDLKIFAGDQLAGQGKPVVLPAQPFVLPNGLINEDWNSNCAQTPVAAGQLLRIYTTGMQPPEGWNVVVKINGENYLQPAMTGLLDGNPGVQQTDVVMPEYLADGTVAMAVCVVDAQRSNSFCSEPTSVWVKAKP